MARRAEWPIIFCPSKRHSSELPPKEAKKQAKVWATSGCRECAAEKAKNTTTQQEPTP